MQLVKLRNLTDFHDDIYLVNSKISLLTPAFVLYIDDDNSRRFKLAQKTKLTNAKLSNL